MPKKPTVNHNISKSKRNSTLSQKKPRRKGRKKGNLWAGIFIPVSVVICLIVFSIFLRPDDISGETGARIPAGYYKFAVDLSHHNPEMIVWDSLRVMTDRRQRTTRSLNKAEDIRPLTYIILKASEGISMKDGNFSKYWRNAAKAGLNRGAYHFFRSSKDPVSQARNYIRTVGRIKENDLPPILDIETIHTGCTNKTLNENALVWLRMVEEHYGRKPVVYTSESFARDMLSKSITEEYPMWIARYRERPPDRENWSIWQFTDKAVVYGIDGYVDLNVLSLTFND